ncbi:MAG: SMP-30/gluconolactonase/LRE family protein [Planctomycetes bacterium]|nr:SMP-30/gluconolactonase/LRE family protein [Planctomycetota bacterium]
MNIVTRLAALIFAVVLFAGCSSHVYPTLGSIERLDPALDTLIAPDAKIEVLAEGYNWSEGPVWVKRGGYVIFSDVPENTIFKWKEGEGSSVYLKPSGYTGDVPRDKESGSNGLVIDANGRLILCQHGDRRLARMIPRTDYPRPKFDTIADKYDGNRFNSPNDAAFGPDGALYFTDPPYGLAKGFDDPARELPYAGVFRIAPDGKVTLLTDKLTFPNGLAFSPNGKMLYIAQSDPKAALWMQYDFNPDGSISNGRVLLDVTGMTSSRKGLPDGMKVDKKGNLFATGPGGVLILSPEGKHLGTILTGQATGNCCFGEDGHTLFITADMYLLRVRLRTCGMGF